MGKEVPTPAGMRFLISEQTLARNTRAMTSPGGDPGSEPATVRPWSDGRLRSFSSVVGLKALFSAVEDGLEDGVFVCRAGLDVSIELSGSGFAWGSVASGFGGTDDNRSLCSGWMAASGRVSSSCRCRNSAPGNGFGS